jgi:hypothetical protein
MEYGLKILYTGSTGNLIKHLARKHTLIKNSSALSVENKVLYIFIFLIKYFFFFLQ